MDLSSPPPADREENAYWFVCHRGRLMVSEDPDQPLFPQLPTLRPLGLGDPGGFFIGYLSGRPCYAVELESEDAVPSGHYLADLRRMLGELDDGLFAMAGRASQLITWYGNHRYCSRCGTAAAAAARDRAMICPACGYAQYPRITPCVIALVTAGDHALLARSARARVPMFSCLAGFMEPGESAEQAVVREVREETAVQVRNLRYHGSQPWPFPHALMLGFFAEHAGGEICVDRDEILEADWWHYRELPLIPPGGSIARELIDSWVGAREGTTTGGARE